MALPTLWLVGMMGAGKTTVGKLIAADFDIPFVDLDDEIEADAAATIPEIFARAGEEGFRLLEFDAVKRVAGRPCVVATGGGVVTQADAVDRMRRSGVVVWLRASSEVLAQRVGDGSYRPMLAGDDPAEAVAGIAARRAAAYESAAHHRVDAEKDPVAIAEEVKALWTTS